MYVWQIFEAFAAVHLNAASLGVFMGFADCLCSTCSCENCLLIG